MDLDRLQKALQELIRKLGRRVDYLAAYPATVLTDHGDHHLDVQPDHPDLPSMVRIPLRLFLPGVQIKVVPGARVIVTFENGDPTMPIATLWQTGQLDTLTIETTAATTIKAQGVATVHSDVQVNVSGPKVVLADGGPPVARVGDQVDPVTHLITTGSPKVTSG